MKMKTSIYKSKLLIGVLSLSLITGCSKFLDKNDDPNRVTDSNITPELLFTQAAAAVGAIQGSGNYAFLENWLGYWSASNTFAIQQDETTYDITTTFGTNLWTNQYNTLFDLYLANKKAVAAGSTVLAATANILSVKLWQDLVDTYGNIPYSQAFQNDLYNQPEYDEAANIYDSLQLKLDVAISDLQSAGSAPVSFTSIDIVNGGDLNKWIKFANTLKLRLLIHESEVISTPDAEIAKINANGGVLESGESVNVNPGYSNDVNKQSPFFGNFAYDPSGNPANTGGAPNDYFVSILKSSFDTNRLKRFFSLPSRTPNALNPAGDPATAIIGTDYGISNAPGQPSTNPVFGPGEAKNAEQPQWILTSAESLFLKAEAVARKWMSGDAKTAYEDAVRESFIWLDVSNTGNDAENIQKANTYLSTSSIARWDQAGTTVQSQVKFILYQKYIALCGIDAMESWTDYRRINPLPDNGYLSNNPARISSTLPVRLLYPQTEYVSNTQNVNAQGNIDQFTSKIFWQP